MFICYRPPKRKLNTANIPSFTYYSWVYPFIRLGNQKELELEDVYRIPETDSTKVVGDLLNASWQKELQASLKKPPSLFRAVCRIYLGEFFLQVLFGVVFRCILK